ncbi:MAG TPA: heavy metal-binding domain-containing protein [Trebonia sp.]
MSFTSELSVSEFALAAEAGLRPLRLVGAAGGFYLPPPVAGGRVRRPGATLGPTDYADRSNRARDTVLDRLREEARACGAHIVIGVSLRRQSARQRGPGDGPADVYQEFTAVGTAMARADHADPGPPADEREPVLTNLRVPDYCKLVRHGFTPAGLVAATAVAVGSAASSGSLPPAVTVGGAARSGSLRPASAAYAPADRGLGIVLGDPGTLHDRPEYHAVTRKAYSVALEKLRTAARPLGAAGITAIEIDRLRAEWEQTEWSNETIVVVHAMGTAVAPSAPAPERQAPLTLMPVRHLDK